MSSNRSHTVLLGPRDFELTELLGRMSALPAWRPFDPLLIEFVGRLSNRLLTSPSVRQFPELAALGHWFRKARLLEMARTHSTALPGHVRLGRGLTFHVAPANVDSVFMYSWLISLLAGNANIVRVSQKGGPQQDVLVNLLASLCEDENFSEVASRIVLLTYPHDREVTQLISQACQVRVVWGGDATVTELRSIPLRPTATDLCFADRFSLAAIAAEPLAELDEGAFAGLVHGFYNDTFWFGQQACSSPRMVVWVGSQSQVERAQKRFWPALADEVTRNRAENSPAMLMARLGSVFEFAGAGPGQWGLSSGLQAFPIVLDSDAADLRLVRENHCGNGLFVQQSIASLAELGPRLTDKDQTLAVFGFTAGDYETLLSKLPPRSIDRIVTIGSALSFDPVWDGQDFFASMTRMIAVPQ
jgi:hypothetical protein